MGTGAEQDGQEAWRTDIGEPPSGWGTYSVPKGSSLDYVKTSPRGRVLAQYSTSRLSSHVSLIYANARKMNRLDSSASQSAKNGALDLRGFFSSVERRACRSLVNKLRNL